MSYGAVIQVCLLASLYLMPMKAGAQTQKIQKAMLPGVVPRTCLPTEFHTISIFKVSDTFGGLFELQCKKIYLLTYVPHNEDSSLGGSVGYAVRLETRRSRINPRRSWQHSFLETDHEIFSTVILSHLLIQEGQLSVSGERMYTILVNRLED